MKNKFNTAVAYIALAAIGLLVIASPALFIIGSVNLVKWSNGK